MRIYPNTKLHQLAIKEGKIPTDHNLLNPTYYVSNKINIDNIKANAAKSGAKWIFEGDEPEEMTAKFRARKKRGPLWEYLRY